MKKQLVIIGIVTILISIGLSGCSETQNQDNLTPSEPNDDEDHSVIKEFSGTFTSTRYYPGNWSYYIYIVRHSDDGALIEGTITFTDPNNDVITATVLDVKDDYYYWVDLGVASNLAAVGTATYTYGSYIGNFMFLFADSHIWMALSSDDYTTEWNGDTVWDSTLRDYDIYGAGDFWS
jgi:hypothetical protein